MVAMEGEVSRLSEPRRASAYHRSPFLPPAPLEQATPTPKVSLPSLLHRFSSLVKPPLTLASTLQEALASSKDLHLRSVHFTGSHALLETTEEPPVQELHKQNLVEST